jgi:hypothetical protein
MQGTGTLSTEKRRHQECGACAERGGIARLSETSGTAHRYPDGSRRPSGLFRHRRSAPAPPVQAATPPARSAERLHVDENVLGPLAPGQKAEALGAVEPLDDRALESAGRLDLHMGANRGQLRWMNCGRRIHRDNSKVLIAAFALLNFADDPVPSSTVWYPSRRRQVTCRRTSSIPLSGMMKPNPLATSNHLMTPVISMRSTASAWPRRQPGFSLRTFPPSGCLSNTRHKQLK